MKDERGVKDKGLEADRKEKHLEEKFKAEETSDKVAACAWRYECSTGFVWGPLVAPVHLKYKLMHWRQKTCYSNKSLGFVEDACGHRYGAKYSSERDEGLGGEESVYYTD